jgi:penicillin-binding protein 1C
MAKAGDLNQTSLSQALASPLRLNDMPAVITPAPHFIRQLAKSLPRGAPRLVHTHINPGLQNRISALAAATCQARRQEGLRQAAVLVLRNRDRAVLAWVGSADWHDPAGGQVDGVLARRSPGSALKPFLYALALESGRSLGDVIADEPMTLPVSGGSFRPVDYDGKERGPVRLRVALASSLNLPALRLARELTPAAFLLHLRKLGMRLPKSAEHYGLGLALGDGEVSLLELTTAYSALASEGEFLAPMMWQGQNRAAARQVISAAAARLVTDALADDRARETGFGRHSVLELPFPAAAKTGTSQQHRDNWCLGFTEEFTVGVWVGNFQGKPMTGISGVTGAGPLWRQVMLLVHQNRPTRLPPWPPGLKRHTVCSLSGALPARGGSCPILEEYFAPGTTPKDTCPLHGPQMAGVKSPPQTKPFLTLLVPAPGAVYALDPDVPPELQVLPLKAKAPGPVRGAAWKVNGKQLPPEGVPLEARMNLKPGRHTVELAVWGDWGRAQTKAQFTVRGLLANPPIGSQAKSWLPIGVINPEP